MNWKQWPFYPKSLTDMIGPDEDVKNREDFISLLVSGCSERLGRPLTVLVPDLDSQGEPIEEPNPHYPNQTRWKLRRIDQINPREHFVEFCTFMRDLPGQEHACQQCDLDIAWEVINTALHHPDQLDHFVQGYPCRMHLIDQASVIRYNHAPVAVVFSGQFLPDDDEGHERLRANINKLAQIQHLSETQTQELHRLADKLETRAAYLERHLTEIKKRTSTTDDPIDKQAPTLDQFFLDQVHEIERIARAQFEMQKRDRESRFRHELRQKFPFLRTGTRLEIAQAIQPILEEVRRFSGSEYLAFFISPQRYISYEHESNLLSPFAYTGIPAEVMSGITHFNWRKAGLTVDAYEQEPDNKISELVTVSEIPTVTLLTQPAEVQRVLRGGLKGGSSSYLHKSTLVCQIHFSDAYRAVLLWGPFPHLSLGNLTREEHFIEEVSEMVMMRVLSSVQQSDAEQRTSTWSDIAGLLGHYSRRAMTPVSTGVRIISDYLQNGRTYSREDALNASESLEAASRFISQAVRAPLFSFAAMAEEVYEFAPASLEAIVHDCVALYQPMTLDKGITVKVDRGLAELPLIEVDTGKLRDAVGYILDNAIKYSHPNKEVRIYSEISGSNVRLTVEDFGQGIKEEELHLLFGRGFQGARSRKAIYEVGEGLGLFHARLIVEAHKGSIWCKCRSGQRSDSSARLEGYRVWFTLEIPLKQIDA